jgi:hypothetical protein
MGPGGDVGCNNKLACSVVLYGRALFVLYFVGIVVRL